MGHLLLAYLPWPGPPLDSFAARCAPGHYADSLSEVPCAPGEHHRLPAYVSHLYNRWSASKTAAASLLPPPKPAAMGIRLYNSIFIPCVEPICWRTIRAARAARFSALLNTGCEQIS